MSARMYRVWFKNDSARLVTADSEAEARSVAKNLAEIDAADINLAYKDAKAANRKDRAQELAKEYMGCTVVVKVEKLS